MIIEYVSIVDILNNKLFLAYYNKYYKFFPNFDKNWSLLTVISISLINCSINFLFFSSLGDKCLI